MPKKNRVPHPPQPVSAPVDAADTSVEIGDVVAMLIEGDGNKGNGKNKQAVPEVSDPNLPVVTQQPTVNDPLAVLGINANNPALKKFLADPLQNDALVSAVRKEHTSSSIMNVIMQEIAEEVAFIKAWRNQNFDGDKDLSEATFKMIRMLGQLIEAIGEKEKLKSKVGGKIDFHSRSFERVMKHFLDVIYKTFKGVNIPKQYEDIFFSQLAKEFNGFEKTAEKLYYDREQKQ